MMQATDELYAWEKDMLKTMRNLLDSWTSWFLAVQDEDESRDKQKLHLTDKAEWQYSDREKENLEVISN